ncbi:biotin transporter BioY [Haloimpatiens sp. FM7330]|uniref:biotin transporter BioY n=1 Tax=Haloimpatiens sp. FM7330 TaxID=3298610 RepID=UPI003640916C
MRTKDITLVGLFAALMVIGAYISIPTPWVPLTFQPFFACLAGVLLGSRLGALSQIVYVLIGLIGAPVFQGGSGGPGSILSPTFGYLIGFIIGAYVIGKITENRNINIKNLTVGIYCGLSIFYIFGVLYLYLILNFYLNKPINVAKALQLGFTPFIIKDLVFSGVAVIVAHKTLPALKKSGLSV